MTQSTCSVDECDSSCLCRGWCRTHYMRWYKAQRKARPCAIGGCGKAETARGMCAMHYSRWRKHGDPLAVKHRHDGNRVDPTERKRCEQCGDEFGPTPGRAHAQWARTRFCGRSCSSAWKGQQQRPLVSTQRGWAAAWERRRRIEDRAELRAWKPKVWPHCRLADKPQPRYFLGWYCKSHACRKPFVYFAKRAQSPYCAPCNQAHHRRPANRRARQNGVAYEPIDPAVVFQRDGYRCQLCKRKTRGQFPHPRSPTVDHIVPLAKGGPHLYVNVQCACFECNWKKSDGTANDQLRLIA